jgi:hypothetical protein
VARCGTSFDVQQLSGQKDAVVTAMREHLVGGWPEIRYQPGATRGFVKERQEERMAVSNYSRSISNLFVDAGNQLTILVRKEGQLARAEMSEKISDLAVGLGLLVGGSVLLIPAFVILLQAAVAALVDARVAIVWATLIVGGATLTIGLVLLAIGVWRLKAARPIPTKTLEQLQHDAEVAKSQLRNDHGTSERTP